MGIVASVEDEVLLWVGEGKGEEARDEERWVEGLEVLVGAGEEVWAAGEVRLLRDDILPD